MIGQYGVPQQLWLAVMEKRGGTDANKQPGDTYGAGDDLPAYYVSWYDAVVFCNRLSQLTGLEPAYSKDGQTNTSAWGAFPPPAIVTGTPSPATGMPAGSLHTMPASSP